MTQPMITRVSDEQRRRFDRLAERSGMSRAELLRTLVTDYLDQHEPVPRAVPSWADIDPAAPPLDADEHRRVLDERHEQRAARR